MIAILLKFLFIASTSVFIAGCYSSNSWILESTISLSVFHLFSTIFFITVFYFFASRIWFFSTLSLFSAQLVFVGFSYFNASPFSYKNNNDVLTIAQYNVYCNNSQSKKIVDWLLRNNDKFDIIFLQEVNADLIKELQRLKETHPFQIIKPDNRWLGRAFLSKIPITSYKIHSYDLSHNHYLCVTLKTTNGKEISFYGIHTTPPISDEYIAIRNHEIDEIINTINRDTSDYKVMAGDLNMTPYSSTFRHLCKSGGLSKPRIHNGSWPTEFPVSFLRIQIDHLLVSSKIDYISQEKGDDKGSDHLPIVTKIALK